MVMDFIIIMIYILPHAAVSDFSLPSPNTITVGPGLPNFCININIVGDQIDERNEFFLVSAQTTNSQLLGISPTTSSTEVCITDDDGEKK